MDSLGTALMLLAVGMSTVFSILLFLILSGRILIRIVNRYFPDDATTPSAEKIATTEEAIRKAIDIVGHGQWKVISLKKVNK